MGTHMLMGHPHDDVSCTQQPRVHELQAILGDARGASTSGKHHFVDSDKAACSRSHV